MPPRISEVNTFKFWVVEFFSRDTLIIGWAILWRFILTTLLLIWVPIFAYIWLFNCLGWATRKVLIERSPFNDVDKEAPFFSGENISLGWSVGWRQLLTLPQLFIVFLSFMILGVIISEIYGEGSVFGWVLALFFYFLFNSLAIGWAAKRVMFLTKT